MENQEAHTKPQHCAYFVLCTLYINCDYFMYMSCLEKCLEYVPKTFTHYNTSVCWWCKKGDLI